METLSLKFCDAHWEWCFDHDVPFLSAIVECGTPWPRNWHIRW